MRRTIILHVHLFKNAGTSFDSMLKNNFHKQFAKIDLDPEKDASPRTADLLKFLEDNPRVVAVSAHEYRYIMLDDNDYLILPVVFLRDPIKRAISMYNYFKSIKQHENKWFKIAQDNDISRYMGLMLSDPGAPIHNFQTARLAKPKRGGNLTDAHFELAKQRIKQIPMLGIVERFDDSVQLIGRTIKQYFPNINLDYKTENVSKAKSTITDKNLIKKLEEANRYDIELYNLAMKEFETRFSR